MNHFCYIKGFHANQEPLVLSSKAPWYKQVSLTGWLLTVAVFGIITGACTGIYSCAQKTEVKEVLSYEFPIGHTFESQTQPAKAEIPKREKLTKAK